MILEKLALQHFRSHQQKVFSFDPQLTVIIGQNAAGKTNLVESIHLFLTGKSFKSEKEGQTIHFGENFARIKGIITGEDDKQVLEVLFSLHGATAQKKYLVNSIPRRRVDFAGKIPVVLFTPEDLLIVSGQPSARRTFLNDTLEQLDRDYHGALTTYTKALRQRNALLDQARETGMRDEKRFVYWDELLIKAGGYVTKKRAELIADINARVKELFSFTLEYDSSLISAERLAKYKHAEMGAGVTLVGPHRDDVFIKTPHPVSEQLEDVKYFSSRGQQRLVTLELKLAQIEMFTQQLGKQPLLLLDDIFSELDSAHISHVLKMMDRCQTIITTTHREFLTGLPLEKANVIELNG